MAELDWFDFRRLSLESQKELIQGLRDDGYSDAEVRRMFGIHKSTWQNWIAKSGMKRREPITANSGDTLCWDCRNALKRCSWSRNFEPVEGWEAIMFPPAPYVQGKCAHMPNYKVISCPEFIED